MPRTFVMSPRFWISWCHSAPLIFPGRPYCLSTTDVISITKEEVFVKTRNGLPYLPLPLPRRSEVFEFYLKPFSQNVSDLISQIRYEDPAITKLALYSTAGNRISHGTSIDTVLQDVFYIVLDTVVYKVGKSTFISESLDQLMENRVIEIRSLVNDLYMHMNLDTYVSMKIKKLQLKLMQLRSEIQPLEEAKAKIENGSLRNASILSWFGLGLMGFQFGLLARLTWWDLSWDFVEPFTYFITYGTLVAMYAYFVLMKQEYNYPAFVERIFLILFYKGVKKTKFDVKAYNTLKEQIIATQNKIEILSKTIENFSEMSSAVSDSSVKRRE